jgi:hypothetical protein
VFLVSAINVATLDSEPGLLHLHAGAAARGDRAVLVAADRGTGKSTTIAHLVNRGWEFITDEMVRLYPDKPDVGGTPKPLTVKPGGTALLPHLEPFMIPPGDSDAHGLRFVPMGAAGAEIQTRATSQVVVLLKRETAPEPAIEPLVRPLHPADAVVGLMQETLDADRFGRAAVRLAELAASSHCVEMVRGTPERTAAKIEELARQGTPQPMEVTVLPPSDAISPTAVSVQIGDAVVVHDTKTGRILAMDRAGARVWKAVAGWEPDSEIDIQGPVIAPFIAQLHALGVLARQ